MRCGRCVQGALRVYAWCCSLCFVSQMASGLACSGCCASSHRMPIPTARNMPNSAPAQREKEEEVRGKKRQKKSKEEEKERRERKRRFAKGGLLSPSLSLTNTLSHSLPLSHSHSLPSLFFPLSFSLSLFPSLSFSPLSLTHSLTLSFSLTKHDSLFRSVSQQCAAPQASPSSGSEVQ